MKHLRTILLIAIVILIVLGLYERDRVMIGFRAGLQGYEIAKTTKDARVIDFDQRRSEIKIPEGAEATREAFEALGYTVTVRHID